MTDRAGHPNVTRSSDGGLIGARRRALGERRRGSGLPCRDAAGAEERERRDERDDGECTAQCSQPRFGVLVDDRLSRSGLDAGLVEGGSEVRVGEEWDAARQLHLGALGDRGRDGGIRLDAGEEATR